MNRKLRLPAELVSDRLILRPVSLEYAQAAFEALDDEVTEHMFFDTPESVEDTKEFIRENIQKKTDGSDYAVFVFKKATGELIGGSGLHHIDTKTPELGIWIKVSEHGHKYGLEAVATLTRWAEENLDYDYLLYPVVEINVASRKIPEALGGVLERSYAHKDAAGNDRTLVEYRIYRPAR